MQKKFSALDILYPGFVALSQQNPVIVPFLPFSFEQRRMNLPAQEPDAGIAAGLPVFEPSKQIIFNLLVEQYIGIYFYEIMMEAKLSELSARTVSMENASGKTVKFITKLHLTYTKERRKSLTQKQLESFTVHTIS
jgi:F-type H+-transporting ATPase subunit gamma